MNPKIIIALLHADDAIKLQQQIQQLQDRILDLGRKNIALAAEAERAEQLEQQLAESALRIRELEAALVVARLPAASRDNVVQLVLEAA